MSSLKLFLFSFFLVFSATESKTHWEDTEALKQLKHNINLNSLNPGSCVSTWDFTYDPCENLFSEKFTCGFRCDVVVSQLSRVTELSLDQAGYSGSLSSIAWGNLPYLETLDLSNNYFTGSIPDSLSNLTRLSRLSLSSNSFTGEIPSSIGTSLVNLQELYLDNNNLQGTIPSSFNNLKSLTRLELQRNKLTGKITDLSSLVNLYHMDLSDNGFSDNPFSFPVSLVQISIRNNNISGGLASEAFKNLMYLQVLDFTSNKINGYVPSIFFQLPSLQQLTLSFNEFSSIEAPSFGTVTQSLQSELIAVDLSNNQLQGFLPSFLAFLPRLSSLSLENNRFTGLIPVQFALKTVFPGTGVAPFGRLLLGGNYLLGGIPRPLLVLKQDSANVSLVDNCLFRCPHVFFFCQGGQQKSSSECSRVIIP
ncbi:receptor-like protein 53 [Vicia villosa]|uniref:receptor-like protein 53 n=1 Tax=Vicia villosa TaxID=3911 RepID=UPI00273AF4B4|nr:receptor-like protein 53 [Vicia villosa]